MLIDNLRLLSTEAEAGQEPEYYLDLADRVSEAIERSHDYFIHCQHPDGNWWFELESNVTITAEYLMLLFFAGIEDKKKSAKIANHILKQQRPDGTWAIYKGGQGDLSTSVEAYFALKLAGYQAEDPRLEAARRSIIASGGPGGDQVFHEDIPCPLRPVRLEGYPFRPRGNRAPASLVPSQHLQFFKLGKGHLCAALGRARRETRQGYS